MVKALELRGKVFGAWTVLQRAASDSAGKARWMCQCVCGTTKEVNAAHLSSGRSTNCGCLRTQKMVAAATAASTRHAMSGTKTYQAWVSMKKRCNNPNNPSYKHYGGRGITYDPAWERFEAFFADMGVAPEGLSLDRKEVDGSYCKENCRWATILEQASNKTNSNYVVLKGETMTLSEVARRLSIDRDRVRKFLADGLTPDEIQAQGLS